MDVGMMDLDGWIVVLMDRGVASRVGVVGNVTAVHRVRAYEKRVSLIGCT